MSDSDGFKPVEGLDVHETEDGLIVFNPATDRVHHLNHTAGAVFVLCDGKKTASQLAQAVGELFGLSEQPTEGVSSALQELVGEGVLVAGPIEPV